LTGRILQGAQIFYLGLSGHSQACSVKAPCRTFFFVHSHALVSGRANFILGLSGHSSACNVRAPCRIFFFVRSQPRSSAGRAVFFLGVRLLPLSSVRRAVTCPVAVWSVLTARAATFCDRSLLHKPCQSVQFFLLACPVASGQQLQGAQKFFVDLTGRCPLSFVCPRSKKNLFFCSVASAQQSARAKLFFFAQLFLLLSGLICAELFFDFFVAHGISAVHFFRILR
jgi:hypothetical protein